MEGSLDRQEKPEDDSDIPILTVRPTPPTSLQLVIAINALDKDLPDHGKDGKHYGKGFSATTDGFYLL